MWNDRHIINKVVIIYNHWKMKNENINQNETQTIGPCALIGRYFHDGRYGITD